MSVSATGTATASGSGTYKQWLLFGHTNVNFSMPQQSRSLSVAGQPVMFSADPAGSLTLGYDNQYQPLTPLSPQFPEDTSVSDLSVDIQNGAAWNFSFNPITIELSTSIVGIPIELDVILTGNNFHIEDFAFQQDGTPLVGTPSPTGPLEWQALMAPNGTLSGTVVGDIRGTLVLPLGLGTVDLGVLASINESLAEIAPLPGMTTFSLSHDPDGLNPADLGVMIDSLPLPPLTFDLDIAPTTTSGNFNVPSGSSGISNYNVTFSLDSTVTISDLTYHLEGVIPGAVVPEPSALVCLGLGIAACAWIARRR